MTESNRNHLALENGSRIVSLPGTEGTIRGFSGAALIVEDEAAQVMTRSITRCGPARRRGGRLILMSTHSGKRGHFFEAWQDGGAEWQRVGIPATACAHRAGVSPKSAGRWAIGGSGRNISAVVATTVRSSYDLVMGALSDEVAPLFPVAVPADATATDADVEPLFLEVA